MAGYRQFHTKFWKDEWLINLTPLERYLFSYLFTNDLSSISGIYKLPFKVIQNETDLDKEFITATLKKFQDAKKIYYQDGVMWIVRMAQHHKNASPKTMTKVRADIAEISDCPVKQAYLYYQETGIYCIDMVSIQVQRSVSLTKDKTNHKCDVPAICDEFGCPIDPDEQPMGLSSDFEQLTGITAYDLDKWEDACQNMVRNKVTREIMQEAIRRLKDGSYQVTGPWSIQKTAIGLAGGANLPRGEVFVPSETGRI